MSQADDLNVARDSFSLTESRRLKIPEYTICTKSAEVTDVMYVQGGLSNHSRDLNITLRDKEGSVLRDFLNVPPGTQLQINPPLVIGEGIQVDGTMPGGFTGTPPNAIANPFAITDIVHWDLEIMVRCLQN